MQESELPGAPGLRLGGWLGPYRLESFLGEGAIGIVLRATPESGPPVALKVLKRALSRDEVYVQRFVREARVAAEVRHRHLVQVLDSGEAGGYYFLASRYVNGGSLHDLLATRGAPPIDETIRLAAEIAAGLDALHRREIVHRDVKPSNVMLDEGRRAALTDFGLAKGPAYTVLTKPGQVLGTLDYIAPELIRGEDAAPACDVYALGCLVYELLTGSPPFAGRGPFEVAAAHLDQQPPAPSSRRPEISSELGTIVLTALAKDASMRPRTATAFAHLLRAARSA